MESDQLIEQRRTRQPVLPARPGHAEGAYDIYPVHDIGPGRIVEGHGGIAGLLPTRGLIVVDGYPGVFWQEFRDRLTAAWQAAGVSSTWVDVATALRPEAEVAQLVAPYLGGDDPIFGTAFTGDLAEFFDPAKLAALAPSDTDVTVLYGPGAALAGWDGTLVWLEVPKNEIQFRARAGQPTNLGTTMVANPKAAYKRNYFVDWPVVGRHKQCLLAAIDVLVDEQRPAQPTAIGGSDLRAALSQLVRTPLRARPWFEPGAWGGQWMKQRMPQLPQDVPNYAWSFELIAPENGLVLASDGLALEVPFDTLLFHDNPAMLGEAAERFGPEFPIRFDFLDTFAGGNLSVQVHPWPDYIREHFGERFTQDETYYILDAEPGARVYLGFQEDIDPAAFRAALEHSVAAAEEVDIERYVQTHPAAKHDLFLIPHGTIHCSGINNLVLEISATPYIFTFKLYDWLRLDLDGKPRPINIERGMANLDFERKGERVTREFISHPEVLERGAGWQLVHVPTHPLHFYDVHRIELFGPGHYEFPTNDSVQVMSLVEGQAVTVEAGGKARTYHYAETFVVPAAAGQVRLSADGPVKVLTAFIKPGRGPR
ncbi:MAG: class I mannose-6-phosphate isomerase [Bifidobacteriaceae bacterium]|jgi:mannose-6-phosphate isomerase class I|nr:class I mannose-6-phosphate isomerase [Bifidobacteriaceae bacterium]